LPPEFAPSPECRTRTTIFSTVAPQNGALNDVRRIDANADIFPNIGRAFSIKRGADLKRPAIRRDSWQQSR
jgi:hypothetical protein